MILRRATMGDGDALTDCIAAAYAPFQALGLPPVAEGVAEDIRDHNVWVAELDGLVRGGIVLVLGTKAHIANLAVHPDARGRGLGAALMNKAVNAAAAAGHDEIHLATHAGMTQTRQFYRALGWTETSREGNKVYFTMKPAGDTTS